MSEHCSEHELETLCLSPDSFEGRKREEMLSHLGECLLCKELFERLQHFYSDLGASLESPPTERDALFARRLLSKKRTLLPGRRAELSRSDNLIETFAEVIQPYRGSLVERSLRYFRSHPYRSVGILSFAAVALAVSLVALRPKLDKNPAIAEPKNGFLVVSNKHGDELWRKYVGASFISDEGGSISEHMERVVTVQDVDENGTNEVLCIFGWTASYLPLNNVLLCYNADGTERWRYELHRRMTFGGVPYSDDYRFYHMEAGDFAHSGHIEVLALARHDPWSPNVLLRMDGDSGKVQGEFWQSGTLKNYDHKDLDHDGIDELIYGGQNNRLQQVCLVVFDPRRIEGSAPAPEGYYPEGMSAGTEKYYVLFPASDLKQYASDVTNEVVDLRMTTDGTTEVIVNEPVIRQNGTLYYYFDSTMACTSVKPSASFTAAHEQLEREGKLATRLNDAYFEALRKGVAYWDGGKFTDHVTMNKHYLEVTKPPPLP